MSEKGANIDLLFRNGLKDYEVLPPSDVWNGISASVRSKIRPVIYSRVAAAAAILIVAGLLSLKWSKEISETPSSAVALNVRVPEPVRLIPGNKANVAHASVTSITQPSYGTSLPLIDDEESSIAEVETLSPVQAFGIRESKTIALANHTSAKRLLANQDGLAYYSLQQVNYPNLQYTPDLSSAKPAERWSITALASPTYYSTINSGSGIVSSQVSSSEEPLFSYSGGVAFSYKVSKRLTIQSGLFYSAIGQKIDGINSFSGFEQYNTSTGDHNFEVMTANGAVVTNNPDVFLSSSNGSRVITSYTVDVFDPKKASLQPVNTSLNQNFSYVELPVMLKYKIIDKTIGINLIGGLSYNLLVNNSVSTTLNGGNYPVGDTKGMNPLSLSSSLGMGMEYNLSSKLSFNLEPTFRYYLNPFSVTTGSFAHPYSFGLFSGVSYKF